MSRFDDGDGEGIPWELWEGIVSKALAGRKGQAALAELEAALVSLPAPRLIEGHLAIDGEVCAVGAFVAKRRAETTGVAITAAIEEMSASVRCSCTHSREVHDGEQTEDGHRCTGPGWNGKPCYCTGYDPDDEGSYETTDAGRAAGLSHTLAWHLGYLNDEEWGGATPEDRYGRMLNFVRRAQDKPTTGGRGAAASETDGQEKTP